MELSVLLALGILFIGIAMSVTVLGQGNINIDSWRASVGKKRGQVQIAKPLHKFIVNKRMLVGVNLALLMLTLVVGVASGRFPYQFLAGVAILDAFFLVREKKLQWKSKALIEKGLPDVLEVIARVYRVHADLKVAFAEVAVCNPDVEVRKLFAEVVKLAQFGSSLEEALNVVAQKVKSDDFDFVVTAITLNTPTGGNLSSMLENTAKMLRDRKEAGDEIKNLMFQSKFSAVAVGILVPLIAAGSLIGSKNAREILLFTPNGRLMFMAAVIWWLIGTVIVKRATQTRI